MASTISVSTSETAEHHIGRKFLEASSTTTARPVSPGESLMNSGEGRSEIIPLTPRDSGGHRRPFNRYFRRRHWSRVMLLVFIATKSMCFGDGASTLINLATQARNPDFSAFPVTKPITVGTSLPPTCEVGQLFFNVAAPLGQNIYGCATAGSWTALTSAPALPAVVTSANGLSFGTQTVSAAGTKTLTLTNTGTAYLALSSVTVAGSNAADFLLSSNCGTIVASGASCTLSVTFKPSLVGDESANIVVVGNQPGTPTTISLVGTGIASISSGGLVVTPSATYAGINDSVTLTSNRPVNWSLVSGSLGSLIMTSSTSATYVAPSSIRAQNATGACQAMPNDSVFNTRVDALPVEQNSGIWVGAMGATPVNFFPDWSTNIADNTTPVRTFKFNYTTKYNGPFVMPTWPKLKRQGGTFTTYKNDSDHHTITVRKDTCQFYEIYQDFFVPTTCRDGSPDCNASSGLTYAWNSYRLPTQGSTDAAGLPLTPLTLRLAELRDGEINHAMRFTMPLSNIHAQAYWPANSTNGCVGCKTGAPYGARFRLKASYDISKFSPAAQVVLTALKRYGMFLADAGSAATVVTDLDTSGDTIASAAFAEITKAGVIMANFEAVDESSLIVDNQSGQVNPENPYQIPAGFASVKAVDLTTSNYQVSVPIALKSVLVGVPSSVMTITAGMSGFQMKSWVNGTTNQTVQWSLLSGAGSISSNGIYTPPASVAGPTSAVLQATSAADPTAASRVYVTVIPFSAPSGSINIDVGNPAGSTDGNGNVWLPDLGFETGAYNQRPTDYPNWKSLANNPEKMIYQSVGTSFGFDMVYSFILPNGNYKVRLMFGQVYASCNDATKCITYSPTASPHWPLHIEANGQIAMHNFDFGLATNYQYAIPIDEYVPAAVIDNKLYIALRINLEELDANANLQPKPLLNGLQIIPDNAAPYLTIDSQQQTSISAGNTLQLYSVGWYMSNDVVWSVAGPGSIDQNGLFKAPTPAASTPLTSVITVTSKTDSSKSASVTLTLKPSN
jgi:hypothetical protein